MKIFERLTDLQPLVGQTLASSDWVTVSQEQIDQFARATGDLQWIHVDPVRAASGPFGSTVAHGFLTLSLAPQMLTSAYQVRGIRMGVNYGLDRVRFPAPVPAGSRLRGHFKLLSWQPLEAGAQLGIEITMELEGSVKPACVAQMLVRQHV
jgi:acyl dehydratase